MDYLNIFGAQYAAMRLVTVPNIIQFIFPQVTWKGTSENEVYLTFDDGPTPQITEWILNTLSSYNVKATFFCIGRNVEKHPDIYQRILNEGHTIGNHSYSHVRGMYKNQEDYLNDIELASNLIDSNLFRPPHGRITPSLIKQLIPKYEVVLWNLLSYDYDHNVSEKQCLKNVLQNLRLGSIVVFHDSVKAERNLKYVLPRVLAYMSEKNIQGKGIQP